MEVKSQIAESIDLKTRVLGDDLMLDNLKKSIEIIVEAYRNGGKVLFCGNGGSAADAQHLAAELSGRYYFDRPPLNAEALHVNTSFLTAAANDYSFEKAYERMTQALGKKGDVMVAFSTSGNSPNILLALAAAREIGMSTIGFSGQSGGKMHGLCDILFCIPSANTPRVQEVHILMGHIICENVEKSLFSEQK